MHLQCEGTVKEDCHLHRVEYWGHILAQSMITIIQACNRVRRPIWFFLVFLLLLLVLPTAFSYQKNDAKS